MWHKTWNISHPGPSPWVFFFIDVSVMLVLLLKWPSIIKTSTIFFMRRYEVYKTWYKSSCFLEFSYSHLTMCCLLECGGHSLLVVVCEVSWYCLLYFNIPKGLPLGPGDYLTALHAHLHHLLHQGVWTLDSTMQFFLSPDTSSTVDLHCVSPHEWVLLHWLTLRLIYSVRFIQGSSTKRALSGDIMKHSIAKALQ